MAGGWPLLERPREFDVLRSALSQDDSAGSGVLLTGAAGVGKTTLARLAASTVNGEVRWVAGTESARSIPLGAFAQTIGVTTLHDPVTFLAAARASLLADGPLVLGVDDAHLLDQLSATLLLQLAIERAARIIATVRSGETVPDAVTSLWKDGHLSRLDLPPFTKKESIELVESALGGHLESLSADLMWNSSGGNALFLRHLVESARDEGRLRKVRGVWQLRGRASITNELAALLQGRLERLPGNVLDALKLLSLCEPVDVDVLCELAGEDAVEEAESRGVIQAVHHGDRLEARFLHPLFGDVVRRNLGLTASRRLRGRLVKAMRSRASSYDTDRIRLAELELDSDQPVDVVLLVQAADTAVRMSDVAVGERFAREALERGGGIEAADVLARALLAQGRPREVEAVLLGFQPDELDEIALLRWGMTRITNLCWSMGDAKQGDEVLALLRAKITHPLLSLIVEGVRSACLLYENRLADAVAVAERVLADPAAPAYAVVWATMGMRALPLMGRGDEVEPLGRGLRAVSPHVDGLLRYPAAFCEIEGLVLTGRLDEAQRWVDQYSEFTSFGQYFAWACIKTFVGYVDLARGRLNASIAALEEAVAAMTSDSIAAWSLPAKTALIHAYALLGRAADAERIVAAIRDRPDRYLAVFDPPIRVAEAWLAAAQGTPLRAIELVHAAAAAAASTGQFAIEAEALHAAVRFGDKTAAGRLAELSTQLDGQLAPIYARHGAALAADDGAALDRCAAEFEQLGALLPAADAAAQAATAHAHHDERAAVTAAAAMANRLAAVCGGASTPAIRAAAQPLPLTAREREIANLIAAGLSNREIAVRLTLSVRTVEGHIYRACSRVGVEDRSELAALILANPHTE
ncbi:MAG TPA: LuxR C-terminal-related transcriptional regulator [Aldersonia sp.]